MNCLKRYNLEVEGETWKGCGRWVETADLRSPHTNVSVDIYVRLTPALKQVLQCPNVYM